MDSKLPCCPRRLFDELLLLSPPPETPLPVPSSFVVISSSRACSFSSPARIVSATACVKRFVATFFVSRLEPVLLTSVFDTLVLYHNRDVHVPFSVLGLWQLHESSFCTSESQASVIHRTGAVGTWCCIVTRTPMILLLNRI